MDKKVVLIVMDGVGISPDDKSEGDAVKAAHTPTLDKLFAERPWIKLKAHGTAVGLPTDDDMGNSEVGHNAIGSGQIYSQGAKLVNESIESGYIFESEAWQRAVEGVKAKSATLHFIGLLSDGNVHSNISHLKAMLIEAKRVGVRTVRVHALLDGRDVPPTSGRTYIDDMEVFFNGLRTADFDIRFASGGGRMAITMDRYRADWAMVERGWRTHVLGEAEAKYASAGEAYDTLRAQTGAIDQDLAPFVIVEDGKPVGPVLDGDSVIFYNFRGDRAMELSMAFDDEVFPYFDRVRKPDVFYAGMLEYDGDLHIPKHYLVSPPQIRDTMTEYLVSRGINEFACSETQKYGHVTYFWNGNRTDKFSEALETYVEIPSDNVPFDQRPWMKSAEITDALIDAMRSGQYQFLRVNYPNGDMVGHTGIFDSVRLGIESVDLALSRVLPVAEALGYTVLLTADHGNADDMMQKDKKTGEMVMKTAHSLNPVPLFLVDSDPSLSLSGDIGTTPGLANIAPTVVDLMGFEKPGAWEASLLRRQ